ncbi:MAG: 30S ribosomal protein S17e [Candidatus Heimdallarchaeota archaeon]|nr:30S ribosomal protein S17e [Candidatus Heimdallarchaeota archaeon]RLI70492.1 MAG: 30S ribosomal protein S17e [Candidatus Gerdarchaeota archaeon]RLI73924.1 MAG: 30S ribosomal protein S17e [Candidatus Heimdallarchaeota archaeon]
MGKIRSDKIKRTAKELVAKYHQHLSTDFDKNKILVAKLTNVQSKRMRNRIAGYVTRIMVQIKDGKVQVIEKLSVGSSSHFQ